MKSGKKGMNRKQVFAVVIIVALIVGAIIYMKYASDQQENNRMEKADSTASSVAIPDVDTVNTDLPTVVETVSVAMPDTVGRDKRPPYEAGYEDGYFSGMDDGAEKKEKASYDPSSAFPTAEARKKYSQGYDEGYAKGFEDGKNGTQFNMPNNSAK